MDVDRRCKTETLDRQMTLRSTEAGPLTDALLLVGRTPDRTTSGTTMPCESQQGEGEQVTALGASTDPLQPMLMIKG